MIQEPIAMSDEIPIAETANKTNMGKMVIAVIVAVNEKQPAAILIGAVMSVLIWLAY